jgi:transposase
VVDAIRYITDNGAKWRALLADFGIPWRTVFGYFARWVKAGALKRILDQLRRRLRLRRRRCAWPVRVIVDSQSVKGAETVSNATRGYDANKHINGRKRHLLVDQDGLLVDLLVTPADVQDRDAARILLTRLHAEHPKSSCSGRTTVTEARSSAPGPRTPWASRSRSSPAQRMPKASFCCRRGG